MIKIKKKVGLKFGKLKGGVAELKLMMTKVRR